ncbi:MAG: hypothetical protein AAF267_05560 [Deinococcota bacterium]
MSEINVWYGNEQSTPSCGLVQRWVNVLGRVSPVENVQRLRYKLNDSKWQGLSVGPDYRRLSGHGDFNIELDYETLELGINHITLQLETTDGDTVEKLVNINKCPEQDLTLPHRVSWTASHPQSDRFNTDAQIIDGLWHIDNGHLWVKEAGYDRAVAVGGLELTSYNICVPVTVYGFAASGSAPMSGGYGLGIALHWQGHVDWGADAYASGQPRHGYEPIGAMLWYGWDKQYGFCLRLESHDAVTPLAIDTSGFQMAYGQTYMLRFQVVNQLDGPCHYALKAWHVGDVEPDMWLLEADGSDGELTHGSALLIAHHTVCSFGEVQLNPVSDIQIQRGAS